MWIKIGVTTRRSSDLMGGQHVSVMSAVPPLGQLWPCRFNVVVGSSASKLPAARTLGQHDLVTQLQIVTHRAPLRKVASDGSSIYRWLSNRALTPGEGPTLHSVMAMAEASSSSEPSVSTTTSSNTIILEAKGEHKATVVFLHGLAQSADQWAEMFTTFNQLHPGIIWILPTAPFRKVNLRDEPCNAWYNATSIFKEGHFIDFEGLDKSAKRVADLLSSETAKNGEEKVKLVVGGFSQGCATTLYITRCSIIGKYSNGKPFPLKLDAAIGLGGWFPTIKTFEDEVKEVPDAQHRAQEIPMFFGHCEDDDRMPVRLAHAAATSFRNVGVKDITVQIYPEGGHACIPQEVNDLSAWMITKLALDEAHTPGYVEPIPEI